MNDQSSVATRPGDVIAIAPRHVGDAERLGEILDVLGEPSHEHYLVRWDDGHESVFYPGSDASVRHSVRRQQRGKT